MKPQPFSKESLLQSQDRLDDLMTGFLFWKQQKIAAGEVTDLDEMLIRWVDASPEVVK